MEVLDTQSPKQSAKIVWSSHPLKPRVPHFRVISENELLGKAPLDNLSFHFSQHITTTNRQAQPREISKLRKTFIKQIEKYCKISSLHGLRYIGDLQLTLVSRLFWFISFSVAVGFAAYFISNIYSKWESSPVIISYNPLDGDLSSIPFPAVTICNMNRAKKSEAEHIVKWGSPVERKMLDDTCDGNTTFNNAERISWETLREFLIRVGNSCSDVLKLCHWGGEIVDCADYFTNELTDEGLCCSFNRLPPEKIYRNWKDINILNQSRPQNVYDWNPEVGYPGTENMDYIPRRPLGAGPNMGLSVIVDAQIENYYCSSTRSTGFKVMLSSPRESPKVADFGFLVGPGFENRISIEPTVREATFSLRSVDIEKRQCYFTNERPLQYYRQYTQKNCLLECQSKYTFKLCRCVPYYLPKNKSIKYCSKKEKSCVEQAKIYMETVAGDRDSCHCLPACFFLQYPYTKSMSYLFEVTSNDLPNLTAHYIRENVAAMHFYFSSTKYSAELKSELFGFTEILSNTGGLLSLFLGFSFLSLVELIYYVSLRVACDMAKQRVRREQRNTEPSSRLFWKSSVQSSIPTYL